MVLGALEIFSDECDDDDDEVNVYCCWSMLHS